MKLARGARGAVPLIVLVASLWAAAPASAATGSATDLTSATQQIGAGVELPVFGIALTSGSNQTLQQVRANFADVNADGDFTIFDIESPPEGIVVYRDSSNGPGDDDVLDAGDTVVSSGFSWSGLNATITVGAAIPAAAEGLYTFFLTVKASQTIADGDDFTVTLPSNALDTSGILPTSITAVTSHVITADSTAPSAEVTSAARAPAANIVWSFTEAVSGVDDTSVVLRLHNNATNLPATVTYDSTAHTATLNPTGLLSIGTVYDTIASPSGAPPIVDGAGNQVPQTIRSFVIAPGQSLPGLYAGPVWSINEGFDSVGELAFSWGRSTDRAVAGDWNDDGIDSPGLVRGNVFFLNDDFDTTAELVVRFGRATDRPVVGDWDGDGADTIGVVRGSTWYLDNNYDGVADIVFSWGSSTDRLVVGDWDGDGKDTPGLVRGNTWYLDNNYDHVADAVVTWGRSSDQPVVGDWNGDGLDSPGLFRGPMWFLDNGTDGTGDVVFSYGKSSDHPVAGDWNG